jgi:hypothetical protein
VFPGRDQTLARRRTLNLLFAHPPVLSAARVNEVKLSTNDFERLCDFVQKSHALDPRGQPNCLGRNFYQARGTYWALNTCNSWTAPALRRAGCPIAPTCCFTSGPLFFQARRFGPVLSHQAN